MSRVTQRSGAVLILLPCALKEHAVMRVPNELIYSIVDYVADPADMARVMRTSKTMHTLAAPALSRRHHLRAPSRRR